MKFMWNMIFFLSFSTNTLGIIHVWNILSELQAVSFQGGDNNSKRAKFEPETEVKADEKTNTTETICTDQEQLIDTSKETSNVGTSDVSTVARTEKSGFEELPKELNEMKIRDEKSKNNSEKVFNANRLSLLS